MRYLLISAIAILLDSTKAQPGLTSCENTDSLCDFDYKTGLRKQCIKRYVLSVSNPNGAGYKNALRLDTDLQRGFETSRCYERKDVDDVIAQHNKKDPQTTVTSQYTKYDIPADSGYLEPIAEVTDLAGFQKQQLQYHNKFRARHGVDGLVLFDIFSQSAQKWAESLVKDDSVLISSGAGTNFGENVAKVVLTDEEKVKYADTFYSGQSQQWYNSIDGYVQAIQDQDKLEDQNFIDAIFGANPFRQTVWKEATKVGFGYAKSADGSAIYIVAWYDKGPKYADEDRAMLEKETKDYTTVQQDLQYWYVNKDSTAPFRTPIDNDEFNQNQLAYHNRYRARHGAKSLVLNKDLVKVAQDYQKGVNKDYPEPYGVITANFDRSKSYYSGSSKEWYSYNQYYNFSTPGIQPSEWETDQENGEALKKGYNAFVQMMWDSTTSVGFSHYDIDDKGSTPFQVVAIYDPPGGTYLKDGKEQKDDATAYENNVFGIAGQKSEAVDDTPPAEEKPVEKEDEKVEDKEDEEESDDENDVGEEGKPSDETKKNDDIIDEIEGSSTVNTIILAFIIIIVIVIIFVVVMKVGAGKKAEEEQPDDRDFTDMKNINIEEEEVELPGTDRKNDEENKNADKENIAFGEQPAKTVEQPKAQQPEQVAEIQVNQENEQVAEQQQPPEDFAVDLVMQNNDEQE